MSKNKLLIEIGKKIILLITFLIIGIISSNQYILYKEIGFSKTSDDSQSMIARISSLYEDNGNLRKQLADLQGQNQELQDASDNSSETMKILQDEQLKYEIIQGSKDIYGTGVTLDINHSLELTQLVDLLDALRNSGAEAIGLNGQRILTNTSMNSFVGKDKYHFEIIGNKGILYDSLMRPGGALDLITSGDVTKQDKIVLNKISN
jgi:uncharacterized protein YlxW (UPF0749 family)